MRTQAKTSHSAPGSRRKSKRSRPMSTHLGQTVPVYSHTPLVASVSGTPPVQMEKGLAELCCGDTGPTTPVTDEAPKPEVPGHLQQPVHPQLGESGAKKQSSLHAKMADARKFAGAIANPNSKKRHAQQRAMSQSREAFSDDRKASMQSMRAQRDERRQAHADKKAARMASKAESKAGRAAQKASRVSTSDKLAASRAQHKATFANARATAPTGLFKHTKALAGDNHTPFQMPKPEEEVEEHSD